jgi:hypothetical protein
MILIEPRTGTLLPELFSIRDILKRTIFRNLKDITNKERNFLVKKVTSHLVHYERHHGPKALVSYMKYLKSQVLTGQVHRMRSGRNSLLQILKVLDKVSGLRLLSLTGRWCDKPATKSVYQKMKNRVEQRAPLGVLSETFGLSDDDKTSLSLAIQNCKLSFKPFNSFKTHVLEGRRAREPVPIWEEMFAMTMAGKIYQNHFNYISNIMGIHDSAAQKELLANSQKYEGVGSSQPIVGSIDAIQSDGSLKQRMVANLIKGYQVAISPAESAYKQWLKVVPECYTFRQREGAERVLSELRAGKKVSSIDLKDSTDNLPVRVFFKLMDEFVLEHLTLHGDAASSMFYSAYMLDRDLCLEGTYRTPYEGLFIKYGQGQGMGRGTSKPQLDISMIMLCRSVGGNKDNFIVNGDDIVIFDPVVAKRFKLLLKVLRTPISEGKTFMYARYGEFSGRLIDKVLGILPVYKGRKINIKDDPFGPLRQYGPDGLDLVEDTKHSKDSDATKRIIKRAASVLCSSEDELSEFSASLESNPFEHLDIKELIEPSILNPTEWSELWVYQKFATHRYYQVLAQMYSTSTHARPSGRRISRSGRSSLKLHSFGPASTRPLISKDGQNLLEGLRRQSLLKDCAVSRFPEVNQRLNKLVDYLNSSYVKTSDGHEIIGYGNDDISSIVRRMRRKVSLGTHCYENTTAETRKSKFNYVRRVNHVAKRWLKKYGV